MAKTKKRILSLAVALVMVFTLLPVSALAVDEPRHAEECTVNAEKCDCGAVAAQDGTVMHADKCGGWECVDECGIKAAAEEEADAENADVEPLAVPKLASLPVLLTATAPVQVNSDEGLQDAINSAKDGDVIEVTEDITVPASLNGNYGEIQIHGEKQITIRGKNSEITIKRDNDNSQKHFLLYVDEGSSVTLENIILDGENRNGIYNSLIGVNGENSTVTLGAGAVLQNNINSTDRDSWNDYGNYYGGQEVPGALQNGDWCVHGGGVYVRDGGKLVMENGSKITGCTAFYGGGVALYKSSTFEMKGGEISSNAVKGICGYGPNGGGVCAESSCSVIMSGGKISNNSVVASRWGDILAAVCMPPVILP